MNKKNIKNYLFNGFTLIELLITVTILVFISGAIYMGYYLSQKAYREGETRAEITQNGRVIIERINREIRQAKEIITELPATSTEATSTIGFEDGHATISYRYIFYYQEDNNAKRKVNGYYFSGDLEENLVPWDATPPPEQALETKVLEEPVVIGEWVSNLGFWDSGLVNIRLTLEKKEKTLNLETKIFGRNL